MIFYIKFETVSNFPKNWNKTLNIISFTTMLGAMNYVAIIETLFYTSVIECELVESRLWNGKSQSEL